MSNGKKLAIVIAYIFGLLLGLFVCSTFCFFLFVSALKLLGIYTIGSWIVAFKWKTAFAIFALTLIIKLLFGKIAIKVDK